MFGIGTVRGVHCKQDSEKEGDALIKNGAAAGGTGPWIWGQTLSSCTGGYRLGCNSLGRTAET